MAQSTGYPNRNITLVLPFAAGSGTDTHHAGHLQGARRGVGVSMVIDNKAGANGSIAASVVARAAPDGYTLLSTTKHHALGQPLPAEEPALRPDEGLHDRSPAPATCPSCW